MYLRSVAYVDVVHALLWRGIRRKILGEDPDRTVQELFFGRDLERMRWISVEIAGEAPEMVPGE